MVFRLTTLTIREGLLLLGSVAGVMAAVLILLMAVAKGGL